MYNKRSIVLIDDEVDMLETCSRFIKKMGHNCMTFENSCQAIRELSKIQPELIITDLKMPECDGFQILKEARVSVPNALSIVITGYASIDLAVQAMKEGAYDFLAKPFSIDQLQLAIEKAFKQLSLQEENQLLRTQLQETVNTKNIIGANGGLQRIFKAIGKISQSDVSVLILGESGTGKEVIARAIHANSERSAGPFIPVDCAAIPENLLESELFGYEKGAFTGAHSTKKGLLEMAEGGTLFLDELGEMSFGLQSKLLRTLEEHSFRRVGGNRLINVDFRVLAATNRDLKKAVLNKEFREDLYYRINVIKLNLPPLRERKQDIPLLVNHFCKDFSQKTNKKVKSFSRAAMESLIEYSWPGNVRELRNVVERCTCLCESEIIDIKDLPQDIVNPILNKSDKLEVLLDFPFHEAKQLWLQKFETEYLKHLLNIHEGNITQAAETAGINRKTIHRLIDKYDLK